MSLRLSMIAPLPPFRGGIPQFATRTWEALVDAGHEVQAIGFTRQYPGILSAGKLQRDPVAAPTPGPVNHDGERRTERGADEQAVSMRREPYRRRDDRGQDSCPVLRMAWRV